MLTIAALPSMAYGAQNEVEAEVGQENVVVIEKVSVPFDSGNSTSDEPPMSIKNSISINGKSYWLLPTYDNKDDAISKIKSDASKVLEYLKFKYELEDFSDVTWEEYREAQMKMFDCADCPTWYNEDTDSYMKLKCFFDIYENDDDNDLMLSIAEDIYTPGNEKAVRAFNSTSSQLLALLQTMLPDQDVLLGTTPFAVLQPEEDQIQAIAASFNTAAAITYAKKYVYQPNTKIWGYIEDKDCTNFVSQILCAGGKHQSYTGKEKTGWWHNKVAGKHTYSLSWQRADSFVNYMGTGGSKTKNHASFANAIKRGNVIALDYKSDGKWDHVGFVTKKSSQKVNGYYPYKVIQHSRNYHAWTTNNINGWASAGSKYNSIYAIVNY